MASQLIQSREENERVLAVIEKLMSRGEKNLTREEDALLELLTELVENFESRAYPIRKTSPLELLEFLLEQNQLKPSALWPVLGSKSRVSEILSGKREISKAQAKRLGEFFAVSPAAFI